MPQAVLPPFDPNDHYGDVHTTLPPEQVIPPHFTDPAFMRADFNGVTLPGHFEHENPNDPEAQARAIIAAGGTHITSGRWAGLWIPFLVGANTTPPTMLMTPMLIMYPADVQTAFLTEYAERDYDDFVDECDDENWNRRANGRSYSPQDILAWFLFLRDTWGFRIVLWRGNPDYGVDDRLMALLPAISFYVHGKEVDTGRTAEAYEASLQAIDAFVAGRIPIGVHFTAQDFDPSGQDHDKRGMGYPIGFPRDTFLLDWSKYDGRVHLMLQLNVDAPAGLQGSATYYARKRLMGLGDGAQGPGAPNSRVNLFEIEATKQLYGRCSEVYGCLRSWELFCGTRDNPKIPPVNGGFANGNRWPNGDPL